MFSLDHGKIKQEIHIFDIDGCIVPIRNTEGRRILPKEFMNEADFDYSITKKHMKTAYILSEFITFYKFLCSSFDTIQFYFVTGRKKKYLESETLQQFKILISSKNHFIIKYFPDDIEMTRHSYFNFKIYTIGGIIMNDKGNSTIHVYDDRYAYFPVLETWAKNIGLKNLIFHKVDDPQNYWNAMYLNYKNLVFLLKKGKQQDGFNYK